VLFLIVTSGVFLTKGKSAKWVSRKMKTGALLLSLSSLGACDGCFKTPDTCYAVAETDVFYIETSKRDTIELIKPLEIKIAGSINFAEVQEFSFLIKNKQKRAILKEDIYSLDNKFDSLNEKFVINFSNDIEDGTYDVYFYNISKELQDSVSYKSAYILIIK